MANLPQTFPAQTGPAVATYNYSDIQEGTAITTFNAFSAENSAGEQYILSTSSPYSHLVSSSGALSGAFDWEVNFDCGALNLPRLMQGTATLNVTWRVTNDTGSNTNFLRATIYKWDGSTETEISTVSGAIISSAAGTMRTTVLKFPNISPTLIQYGEQIRLAVGIRLVAPGASATTTGHIAHDPQNRDDDYFTTNNFDTTKLIFYCPFKSKD